MTKKMLSFFFLLAVQCFLLVNADQNLGISTDFQCPLGVAIYPHPLECNKYYTCYNTEPVYLWQCNDNFLFDLIYNGCNYPERVYCGNRTGGLEITTTTSPKPITCSEQDGFFPAFSDLCYAQFFTCLDYTPYLTSCPSYGVFEPTEQKCVSPNSPACKTFSSETTVRVVDTTTRLDAVSTTKVPVSSTTVSTGQPPYASTNVPSNSPSTATTSKSTITFTCPANSNGIFSDPTNCSRYYTCANGAAYSFICPSGLYFNSAIGNCDWPYNVPNCHSKQQCTNPADAAETLDYFKTNFLRYNETRTPFGVYQHIYWFLGRDDILDGFIQFLDYLVSLDDVYIVTVSKGIEWLKNPLTLQQLRTNDILGCSGIIEPVSCPEPHSCYYADSIPGGARTMNSCTPCPAVFPWLDNTAGNQL